MWCPRYKQNKADGEALLRLLASPNAFKLLPPTPTDGGSTPILPPFLNPTAVFVALSSSAVPDALGHDFELDDFELDDLQFKDGHPKQRSKNKARGGADSMEKCPVYSSGGGEAYVGVPPLGDAANVDAYVDHFDMVHTNTHGPHQY